MFSMLFRVGCKNHPMLNCFTGYALYCAYAAKHIMLCARYNVMCHVVTFCVVVSIIFYHAIMCSGFCTIGTICHIMYALSVDGKTAKHCINC